VKPSDFSLLTAKGPRCFGVELRFHEIEVSYFVYLYHLDS
jgi:hypothetical protein